MQNQEQTDTGIPQSIVSKTVVVKCKAAALVDIDDLEVIQGDLKELSQKNYTKLVKSITTKGFIAPFFVWNDGIRNCLLDGTQRWKVLSDMRAKGFLIPPLPVVWIEAENLSDAKEKLLQITSSYGEVTPEGAYAFIQDIPNFSNMVDDIKLPDFNMGQFKVGFLDFDPPNVEPTGDTSLGDTPLTQCPNCGDIFNHTDNRAQ